MITNVRRVSPSRADPSRTGGIRRKFEIEVRARFKVFKKRLLDLVLVEDAFGLKPPSTLKVNTRFKFNTDAQKLEEFRKWLSKQSQDLILSDPNTTKDDWWAKYAEEAYKQGQGRAFDDTKKPYARGYASDESTRDFYKGSKYEFLSSSFNQPETVEKIQLLSGRTFSDLKGMTDAMATTLTRDLADGLARGDNPRTIADRLEKSLGISESRAETIARTEIIRSHSQGAIDAMRQMGVEEIGVMVEWSTTDDFRVCPLCRPLDGITLKLDEAEGMFPRHPNCRCSPIPAGVGEKSTKQKKSQAQIEQAIDQSIEAEIPKKAKDTRSVKDQKDISKWVGADTKIDKTRPKSILDGPIPDSQKVKPTAPVAPPVVLPTKPAVVPLAKIPGTTLEEKLKHPELDSIRKAMLETNNESQSKLDDLEAKRNKALKLSQDIAAEQAALHDRRDEFQETPYKKSKKYWDLYNDLEEKYKKAADEEQVALKEFLALYKQKRVTLRESLSIKDERQRLTIQTSNPGQMWTTDIEGKKLHTQKPTGAYLEKVTDAREFLSGVTSADQLASLPIQMHQMPAGLRAFHRPGADPSNGAYLTQDHDTATYVHEIAHRIERNVPGILDKAWEFREMRVARSGTKDVKMKDQFPGSNYMDYEIGNKDEFDRAFDDNSAHYIGKNYGTGGHKPTSTEVITMGIEKMYDDPVYFAEKDPEYFNFIIGALRGIL